MTRVLSASGLLTALLAVAFVSRPCRAQQATPPPETLVRLSVSPAPAPRPALRYVLLPELTELAPGNPIEGYFKCYLEQYRFTFNESRFEDRQALLAMPLEDVSVDSRELGPRALAQIDRAARLDKADWQVLLKLRSDGFLTLLPDVQALRSLARSLQARFRTEVANGQLDDAIRTAKTMFAMARHMGEHPCVIGDMVGIAIANLAIAPLEEMLERPGCPNLYWALTNLPDPLISMRPGMDGERMMVAMLFRDLDPAAPMSAEQITKFIEPFDKGMVIDSLALKEKGGIREYLAVRTRDEKKMNAARKQLVDFGVPEACVKTFPPDQVILLVEARECQARFDDLAKLCVLPAWKCEELLAKLEATLKEPALFSSALLPHHFAVRRRKAISSGESRCCDTSRRCECTPPFTAALSPRSWLTYRCRCRTTRSAESHSSMK